MDLMSLAISCTTDSHQSGRLLPHRSGRVLSISHSENLATLLGLQPTEVVEASYPAHNILSLDFEDTSYDFILSDQVLEHVEGNPQQAIDECHRILKPGGIAVHTTCFINPVHKVPNDFWRFTPRRSACSIEPGRRLSSMAAGEILKCGRLWEMECALRVCRMPNGIRCTGWRPKTTRSGQS